MEKHRKNKIFKGFVGDLEGYENDLKCMKRDKTAMIREMDCENSIDTKLVAGFLDRSSGAFEEVCEVHGGEDIDRFLEDFGLTMVLICRKKR